MANATASKLWIKDYHPGMDPAEAKRRLQIFNKINHMSGDRSARKREGHGKKEG